MKPPLEIFHEGKIKFLAENSQLRKASVFFNPMRSFDRDLNVLLINALGKDKMRGLDLFGASGVRGLRLSKETDAFDFFLINDIKTRDIIDKNIDLNHLEGICKSSDFNAFDISNDIDYKFDYIDIDPFGSPIPSLANAFKLIKNKGIIAETATDTAVLYGKSKRTCEERYHSFSFKTTYFNEVGLRILIKRTAEIAADFNFSISPLFFDVRKHYIRFYFKVEKSRKILNGSGFIYQCSHCLNRTLDKCKRCDYCGAKMIKIGPLWLGKLFDRNLVNKMYKLASEQMKDKVDYLNIFRNEKDIVTYYTTDSLASFLKMNEKSIDKFDNRTVLNPKGFRIDMPFEKVVDLYKSI